MFRFWLIITLFVVFTVQAQSQELSVSGHVLDKNSGSAIPFSSIYIEELEVGTLSDHDGKYHIAHIPRGKYRIVARYVGYAQTDTVVMLQRSTVLNLQLAPQSLLLPEVNVMAQKNNSAESRIKITKEAINNIQPSTLSDVLQLLPGQLTTDGTLSGVNQLSIRQSGWDANTALGMSIVSDAVPLSNNANMQLIAGDTKSRERSTVNRGIDLRLVSTDHLQEIEIMPGISSAEYGDLSSGVIIAKGKRGITPWEIRIKADGTGKLAYLGKGFALPANLGTLHAGIDVTRATPNLINDLDNYTRISSQLNYQYSARVAGKPLHGTAKLLMTTALDRSKKDPDLTQGVDTYRSNYNRYVMSMSGRWEITTPMLHSIDYSVSLDYTHDLLKRKRTVNLNSITALPTNTDEGEHEGIYLPPTYLSDYQVDGKPINFFAKIKATSIKQLGASSHTLHLGCDMSIEKNLGKGYSYNITTPPFPNTATSSRPRNFHTVPATHRHAVFGEDRMNLNLLGNSIQLLAGFRLTQLGRIVQAYRQLHGKWHMEPRLNLYWRFPLFSAFGKQASVALRAGYGSQSKFPTTTMLYPDPAYFDYISLNHYSQKKENSLLWLTTQTRSTNNYEIRPNRNHKWEVGIELRLGEAMLAITAFRELSTRGFESQSNFFVTHYNQYKSEKDFDSKPSIGDFTAYRDTLIDSYSCYVNASKLIKQGIEYRIVIPQLKQLHTSFEINGAYYRTTYDISKPSPYRPAVSLGGKPYPYVGFYNWNNSTVSERLNTNVWINTHLPKYRIIFSTVFQCVWLNRSHKLRYSGFPISYMGLDDIEKPFMQSNANDETLRHLVRKYTDAYFLPTTTPFECLLNFKATKEVGNHVRLSFFVNRIAFYRARHTDKYNLPTSQVGPASVFGSEIQIKL